MSGNGLNPGAGENDPLDRTQGYVTPGAGKPQPANLPHIPGITLQFEIARGGMGVVYSGRQDFLDRRVAVKLLSVDLGGDKFAQRFHREAKILAGIKHPYIVACHSAGTTDDGQSYLVMEFIDGPNLKSWIGENGPVACMAALRLARSAAQALAHALSLDVIHRDVKPENILLETMSSTAIDISFPFVPKLVDLGLARMTSESAGLGLTSPGSVMGTPATMSPEQYDEPDSVDFRSDIYGLGCVLYEMLVGIPAFRGKKLTDIITKKRHPIGPNPCDENPDVPAQVGAFVSRMLAANRNARPSSYKDLEERLSNLIASLPVRAPTAPIDPGVTAPTIAGRSLASSPAQQHRPQPSAPPAAPSRVPPTSPRTAPPPPPSKPGPGLLHTAEFEYLANRQEGAAALPPTFHDGSSGAASGSQTGSPTSAAPTSTGRATSRLATVVATAVVLVVGGAVGGWFAFGGGKVEPKEPLQDNPVPQPTPTNEPKTPAKPKNAPPRNLEIHGPEHVSLGSDFMLTATADDADGDKLTYRWSSADGDPLFFKRSDRNPAEARVFDGLPGESFFVDLEVSDGKNEPVRKQTEIKLAMEGFPSQPVLVGFKTNPKWSIADAERRFWDEIRDVPTYVACRTAGELRTITYSLGSEAFWHVLGELESKKDDLSPVFAEVGVRLELGERGWIALCTRHADDGDKWTIELQEAHKQNGVWKASHLEPKKLVEWTVDDQDRFGLVSIQRRRDKLSLRVGQQQLNHHVSHEVSLEGLEVEPRVTLFAKGGRGAFHGFTLL